MDESIIAWAERLASTPLAVLLMVILVLGYREWWVFGHIYRAMRKDRDEWRRIALESTGLVRVASHQLRPEQDGDA